MCYFKNIMNKGIFKHSFGAVLFGLMIATISLSILTNNAYAAPPEFDKITVESNNTKNTNYAKMGDTVTFTLYLKNPDTWRKNHNWMLYRLGGAENMGTPKFPGSNSPILSQSVTFKPLLNHNGHFEFKSVYFQNTNHEEIIGGPKITDLLPYIPNPNVIVDTKKPTIEILKDFSDEPNPNHQEFQAKITDKNLDDASYKYGFSTNTICNESDTYDFTYTNQQLLQITDGNNYNDQYLCLRAEDAAGNISYARSEFPLMIGSRTPTPTEKLAVIVDPENIYIDSGLIIVGRSNLTIRGKCTPGNMIRTYGYTDQNTSFSQEYLQKCNGTGEFEEDFGPLAEDYYSFAYADDDPAPNIFESLPGGLIRVKIDLTPPTLTLKGAQTMSIYQGDNFTDPGVNCDNDSIDCATQVIKTGSVNVNKLGTYQLTYSASDLVNNTATITRTVKVLRRQVKPSGNSNNIIKKKNKLASAKLGWQLPNTGYQEIVKLNPQLAKISVVKPLDASSSEASSKPMLYLATSLIVLSLGGWLIAYKF